MTPNVGDEVRFWQDVYWDDKRGRMTRNHQRVGYFKRVITRGKRKGHWEVKLGTTTIKVPPDNVRFVKPTPKENA